LGEGDAVIRQAISCDICGAEKKQTNHWFVAYEQGGELRVSGWSSRNRLRAGSKHLCGQACMHKLADEFMERIISKRIQSVPADEIEIDIAEPTDTSLTIDAGFDDFESSARLITPPAPIVQPAPRHAPALVPMPERLLPAAAAAVPPIEMPRFNPRDWRTEAWERERERMMQASSGRSEHRPRRLSQA
jgi:hypothetical protein